VECGYRFKAVAALFDVPVSLSIVPGLSMLLCAVPIFWYDLVGARKEKITKELAEQRKLKGIPID
jgi:Na+/melibiose symporter-like transporter